MYIVSGVCIYLREEVNVYMYVTYHNEEFYNKVKDDYGTFLGRSLLFPLIPWYWWWKYLFETDKEAYYITDTLDAVPAKEE